MSKIDPDFIKEYLIAEYIKSQNKSNPFKGWMTQVQLKKMGDAMKGLIDKKSNQ